MAAKTPATGPATSGFVDPHRGVFTGAVDGTSMLSNGAIANGEGMRLQRFFFQDIDSGDTWDSGIPQIRAVAWQPDVVGDDVVTVTLSNVSTGRIGFIATNANSTGWLWVLSGGSG